MPTPPSAHIPLRAALCIWLLDSHGTETTLSRGMPLEAKGINCARQRMTMMIDDEQLARMRTHRNNIHRYRHLLQTKLTELERDFINKRLAEEQSTLENLAASTVPMTLKLPNTADHPSGAA